MKYIITEEDKNLLLQDCVDYKYKLVILDKNKRVLDEIESIQSIGNYSINADSSIRRTTFMILYLREKYKSIEDKISSWIGYNFKLQIGIYSIRDDKYKWFDCGFYLITEANTTYSEIDNSLSTTLSDWYFALDGTRNGQIGGAPIISIPVNDEQGNIKTIKTVTYDVIHAETEFRNYIIEDIGEFYGMPQNNPNYLEYRRINPEWNGLPYDLEYEAGCTVGDILSEVNNLYPNCQMYFDIFGNFCFNLIPSCEHDAIILNNDYLQQIILGEGSESTSYGVSDIKNVTEVFGANYEIDFYAESCTSSTNIYTLSEETYTNYATGDYIAFEPDKDNINTMKIKMNGLESIPLYYEFTTNYVKAGELKAGHTHTIKIKYINGSYVAYYLGQFQPHALCVLTNNAKDTKYTKQYFAEKYNCDINNVILRVENSPFAVQKIGEILDVKTGDEFNNILSDSVARENAIYFNRKSTSLNDTVTIRTKMIPFLDVNEKVSYKKQQEDTVHEYIVKSVDNDVSSMTSSITMRKFYPLYYAN